MRAALAKALGLGDPKSSWHSTRDGIAALAAWMTLVCGTLGKIGEDLLLMTQSGVDEVRLAASGSSSTMPQKNNPVAPSLLVAIARQSVGLNTTLQSALVHRQQRDAAAWMSEWLSLPQLILLTGRALSVAEELAKTLKPNPAAMTAAIEATQGMVFAETLSFALAKDMPRAEAQAQVKTLVAEASRTNQTLKRVVEISHPDLNVDEVFDASLHLGTASNDAHSFAQRANAL